MPEEVNAAIIQSYAIKSANGQDFNDSLIGTKAFDPDEIMDSEARILVTRFLILI